MWVRETEVPVMPKDTCQKFYGDRIKTDMFCAGYAQGGVDACQGDSRGLPFLHLDLNINFFRHIKIVHRVFVGDGRGTTYDFSAAGAGLAKFPFPKNLPEHILT